VSCSQSGDLLFVGGHGPIDGDHDRRQGRTDLTLEQT
jgi:hypothetical protein